ncbi:MAG: hypothetical protein A3E38_00600 [Candidatus Moranbacteria bacterium RIFCSPHIGHO2_12_FULL_54_9]|nr:MAG: hypothetical protein A2878_00830 [Candidatus Moranbacteria bacterium RIFCSPHIGHO2_01_FULL_54_31]OGI24740.1 MAG: hypothetical protein A3E38_00600 [Candidatus Moranbacteria bacterium RIFCSPHIGHO2_12_FULL_54_9]
MANRGVKPQGKVKLRWSANFAYAIGLLVTDGSLSNDGRHILLVSKDIEQLDNFLKALGNIKNKLGKSKSGYTGQYVPRIQFSDALFHRFLVSIGITPNKTKTIGEILMPDAYFFDFLRGHHDGDGCFYSYFDPRWKSSFMYYLGFVSASKAHIDWIRNRLKVSLGVWGHITKDQKKIVYNLKYAKKEALKILRKMYSDKKAICLSRKKLKIVEALGNIEQQL